MSTTRIRPEDDLASIADVVRAARRDIPFYREHLPEWELSSLGRLPTFHKGMTAGHGRYPISAAGPGSAHRVVATSGTTGDRLFVAFDRIDWERVGDWLGEVADQVGMGSCDVLLNTHCYGLWVGGPALDLLADRAGACLVPLGPVSPELVLESLAGGVGTAISATPSYLRRLIEAADASGFDLTATGLRLGFIGAEPAESSLRSKLLSLLPVGFRWVELYGLTETGGPRVAFAAEPTVPELTVNTRDFHVEVLERSSDQPVPLGKVGELTITTKRSGSPTPLIRYRTRDLVRVAAADERGVRRISRILGRADDAVKIGGVLMYPSAVAEVVSAILPASAEWRATVRTRDNGEHELIVEAQASETLCGAVQRSCDERIGLRVSVVSTPAEAFVRSRDKTRRTVVEPAAGTDTAVAGRGAAPTSAS